MYVCGAVRPLCGAASSVFKCTRPVGYVKGERSGNFSGNKEKVQVLAKTSGLTVVVKVLFVVYFILLILSGE